ncbi:hypothetical protein, partial [Mycobacterium avium]|uniref:hypothetical protein n=1 Tax=Mycobacterium avium TaxID=1764 RepID=UPI001F47D831
PLVGAAAAGAGLGKKRRDMGLDRCSWSDRNTVKRMKDTGVGPQTNIAAGIVYTRAAIFVWSVLSGRMANQFTVAAPKPGR